MLEDIADCQAIIRKLRADLRLFVAKRDALIVEAARSGINYKVVAAAGGVDQPYVSHAVKKATRKQEKQDDYR